LPRRKHDGKGGGARREGEGKIGGRMGKDNLIKRVKVGESGKFWDSSTSSYIFAVVVSVSDHHIVVRKKDGKLWSMSRNDYESLREDG
jgi:hypothetical protein